MKQEQLEWSTIQKRVNELIPLERNPFGKISDEKKKRLEGKITRLGIFEIPTIDLNNELLTFNKRHHILMALGRAEEMIDVRVPSRALTEAERKEVILDSNIHEGEWDIDLLEEDFADLNIEELGIDLAGLEEDDVLLPNNGDEFQDEEDDDLENRIEGSESGSTVQLASLKWNRTQVYLTDEEVRMMDAELKAYIKETGLTSGFVYHLFAKKNV